MAYEKEREEALSRPKKIMDTAKVPIIAFFVAGGILFTLSAFAVVPMWCFIFAFAFFGGGAYFIKKSVDAHKEYNEINAHPDEFFRPLTPEEIAEKKRQEKEAEEEAKREYTKSGALKYYYFEKKLTRAFEDHKKNGSLKMLKSATMYVSPSDALGHIYISFTIKGTSSYCVCFQKEYLKEKHYHLIWDKIKLQSKI